MGILEKVFGKKEKTVDIAEIKKDPHFQLKQEEERIANLNRQIRQLQNETEGQVVSIETGTKLQELKKQLQEAQEKRNLLWEKLNPPVKE